MNGLQAAVQCCCLPTDGEMEKRKYQRIATDVMVRFREQSVDDSTQEYLQGIAENCGLGGVFLATRHILPKGSIVSLLFTYIQDDREVQVRAKAVVRWTRRLRKPRGMGLEFFEFQGLGDRDFRQYLDRLLAAT